MAAGPRRGAGDELVASAARNSIHTIPLSQRSVGQLRAQADEYRRMASTASQAGVQEGLRRLAVRFDGLADQREQGPGGGDHTGGEPHRLGPAGERR